MSEQFKSMMTIPTRTEPAAPAAAPTLSDGREMTVKFTEGIGTVRTTDGGRTVTKVRDESRDWKASEHEGAGILAGARDMFGRPVQTIGAVRNDTILTIQGVQGRAEDFSYAGLLVKDGENSYSLPPAPDADAREHQTAPAEEAFTDHLPPQVLDALGELDVNLGSPKATDAAVASSIANLAKGDLAGAVKDFTMRTGMDPETARGYVDGVLADTRESIKTRLVDFGVPNAEECLQHLDATMSPSAKASLALELWSGSNAAFKRVANDWLRHMEVSVIGAEMYPGKK